MRFTLDAPSNNPTHQELEEIRHELATQSNAIRLGIGPHPCETAHRLSCLALWIAVSDLPAFERAITVNEAHANVHEATIPSDDLEALGAVSLCLLCEAYPVSCGDESTRRINENERLVRQLAIRTTCQCVPFPTAIGRSWELVTGNPFDHLLTRTGQIAALPNLSVTGQYNPFTD